MNFAVVLPLMSASVTLTAAALAIRLARAPGWGHLRWFALTAGSSAAYGAASAVTNGGASGWWLRQLVQLQVGLLVLQVWAWLWYSDRLLGLAPGAGERWLRRLAPALAAASLVPGLLCQDGAVTHQVDWLHLSYRWSPTTPLGDLTTVAAVLGQALVVWRFAAAWRRGAPWAGLHALALATLLVMAINDALVVTGIYGGPFLLDLALLLPVAAVAGAVTSQFVGNARDLAGLRDRLGGLVEGRGRALARSQEALFRSERLAALGQFAAGVAHEVNNPAAVVAANLHFIAETLDAAPEHAELQVAAAEAVGAMDRITLLVRRLVDAGRLAASRPEQGVTQVEEAVCGAVEEVQARFGPRLRWTRRVEPDLRAAVPGEPVRDLLLALLANAAEAVPEGRAGQVEVDARLGDDGAVHITVADDGRGLGEGVAARAFEPFFTTKPAGQGSGLGLPVARALAESHGGSLALLARAGGGAEARLELPPARS